jgi:hypothetical protein
MEEAASSSTRKSIEVSARCSTICTIMLSERTSKNLKPSPLPGAPNVGEEISGRVAECTRPNPKMRRGLSVLLVSWKREEHKNT